MKGIGSYAFALCPEIKDVYCYAIDVPNATRNTFESTYIKDATLHVPASSIDAYKAVDPWKNFKEIVKINMPKHSLTYLLDGVEYKRLEIEEGESITPEPAPTNV